MACRRMIYKPFHCQGIDSTTSHNHVKWVYYAQFSLSWPRLPGLSASSQLRPPELVVDHARSTIQQFASDLTAHTSASRPVTRFKLQRRPRLPDHGRFKALLSLLVPSSTCQETRTYGLRIVHSIVVPTIYSMLSVRLEVRIALLGLQPGRSRLER